MAKQNSRHMLWSWSLQRPTDSCAQENPVHTHKQAAQSVTQPDHRDNLCQSATTPSYETNRIEIKVQVIEQLY